MLLTLFSTAKHLICATYATSPKLMDHEEMKWSQELHNGVTKWRPFESYCETFLSSHILANMREWCLWPFLKSEWVHTAHCAISVSKIYYDSLKLTGNPQCWLKSYQEAYMNKSYKIKKWGNSCMAYLNSNL